MTAEASWIIEGTISFADDAVELIGATVRVRLQDVTLADAPDLLVAEQVVSNVSADGTGPIQVPYSLTAAPAAENRRLVLRAHVDMDGSGQVAIGDYITMQSYPVSVVGGRARLDLTVRRVN